MEREERDSIEELGEGEANFQSSVVVGEGNNNRRRRSLQAMSVASLHLCV